MASFYIHTPFATTTERRLKSRDAVAELKIDDVVQNQEDNFRIKVQSFIEDGVDYYHILDGSQSIQAIHADIVAILDKSGVLINAKD